MDPLTNRRERWAEYLHYDPATSAQFWHDMLASGGKDLLVILGRGFDPRMCAGVRMILEAGGSGSRKCLLLTYNEGRGSPSQKHAPDVNSNYEDLCQLMRDHGRIHERRFDVWTDDEKWVGSRRACQSIERDMLLAFTDIVVDISAMPRGIYLPILGKILWLLDEEKLASNRSRNLHVMVAENVELDKRIQEKELGEASYLHGFASDLWIQADAGVPTLWIPILGEGKAEQLRRIHGLCRPDEVCPVLPSPSVNPRRGDDLVNEYRDLLFRSFRVEPQDIIYACEWNPFEAYRQIRRTIVRSNTTLQRLGGCKTVISSTSSKLLSIGAFLAAYECKYKMDLRVGFANVEAKGYTKKDSEGGVAPQLPHTMWLAGECYDDESQVDDVL